MENFSEIWDQLKSFDADSEMTSKLLLEMARIGEPNHQLAIYVRSNDGGDIPHFHIVDQSTLGDEFHTCVSICNCAYFHHTGKEDTLSVKDRDDLQDFLSKKDEDDITSTYWKTILREWNRNNSKRKVSMNTPMPNYTELKKGVRPLYIEYPEVKNLYLLKQFDKKSNLYILSIMQGSKQLTKQFSTIDYLDEMIDLLKYKYNFIEIKEIK